MKLAGPVIKHSFTKGTNAVARMTAHINYVRYRDGEDRAERDFFDEERDLIDVKEVRQMVRESDGEGVVAHRVIVSPGLKGVDVKAFTRETLKQLERAKGYELEWRAIVHSNTDHDHAHVVVMGKDRNGKAVRFGIADYKRMREFGERILERDYQFERFLDREMNLSLDRAKSPDRGDDIFNRLFGGGGTKERKNRRDDLEDRRLYDKLNKFQKEKDGTIYRSLKGKQRLIEQQGRLSDFHEGYINAMAAKDETLNKEADAQTREEEAQFKNAVEKDVPTIREKDLLHRLFGIAEPLKERAKEEAPVRGAVPDRGDRGNEQLANGNLQQSVNQAQPKGRKRDEESGGGES